MFPILLLGLGAAALSILLAPEKPEEVAAPESEKPAGAKPTGEVKKKPAATGEAAKPPAA